MQCKSRKRRIGLICLELILSILLISACTQGIIGDADNSNNINQEDDSMNSSTNSNLTDGIKSLIIYQEGKKTEIKAVNESYKGVIEQCEDLFFAADDTYRLTVTSQLIKEMKQKSAIEIIYSKVQKTETPKPIYFTRLLIPLQSKLKDGTVFYSGITEIEYNKKFPDLQIEKAYKQIDEYRSFNVFINTKGLTDLKKATESFLK